MTVMWVTLIRLTVGVIFLFSAVGKIVRPSVFFQAVHDHRLLPAAAVRPTAVVLIAAEAAVATILLANFQAGPALLGAALLLTLFASVSAITIRRQGASECGCLGGLVKLRLGWLSTSATALLAVAALVAGIQAVLGGPSLVTPPSDRGDALILWACASLLAATYWLGTYAQSVLHLIEESIAAEAGE
jgi:hypothetical protein